MTKKVVKKVAVLIGVLVMTVVGSVRMVYAEEAISTKGVIRLYTDDTTSPPTSGTTEPTSSTDPSGSGTTPPTASGSTKPVGRTGLPSTGELAQRGLWLVGILVVLLALIVFLYKRKQKKEEEGQ